MVTIIANINGTPETHPYDREEYKRIVSTCQDVGFSGPWHVYSIEELKHVLDYTDKEEYLLFINLPPNSSYRNKTETPWTADGYDRSLQELEKLCEKFNFKAIHIITGAPRKLVNDDMLTSVTDKFPITLKHKNDWLKDKLGLNFEFYQRCYMVNKIKQASY